MRLDSPFTPTEPITDPENLIGRRKELNTALAAVIGGRNLVVSGERGVGKTSLTTVLNGILRGAASKDHGDIPAAITATFSCSPSSTLEDITDGLLRSMSRSIGYDLTASRRTTATVSAGVGSAKTELTNEVQLQSATGCASKIVDGIAELRKRVGSLSDSLFVLIIDEVDQLLSGSLPGVFVRTSKEMLAAEGLGPVSFVLVGQKNLMPRLRLEHPSVPRAFEVLWIDPLSNESCQLIVSQGEARSGVEFDPEIRSVIASTSRGFPAVVQRLADSCVAVDRDSYVDVLDFEDGLGLAIERIRGEETLESVSALSGHLGRRILALLAERQESVTVDELQSWLPDPRELVSASVKVLEEGGVVERDADGVRVADRLVAAYVTLEETRTRALRDVRALALVFETQGWTVRAVGPEDHRGVDLLASKGRWIFRRRIGAVYVGEAERLGEKGIAHLSPQFLVAKENHGLDEVWLIGRGRVSLAVNEALGRVKGLIYLPWETLERGTTGTV